MLLRLRQMVAHLFQAQEDIQRRPVLKDIVVQGLQERKDMMTESGVYSDTKFEQDLVDGICLMIDKADEDEVEEEDDTPIEPQPEERTPKKKGNSKTLPTRFAKVLRDLKMRSSETQLMIRKLCGQCGGIPEDPLVISCFHVYCKVCLETIQYDAALEQKKSACKRCGLVWTESAPCHMLKEMDFRGTSASFDKDGTEGKRTKKRYQLDYKYADTGDKIVRSSKLLAVERKLIEWVTANPNEKIIVFSEWILPYENLHKSTSHQADLSSMHLIKRVSDEQGWGVRLVSAR